MKANEWRFEPRFSLSCSVDSIHESSSTCAPSNLSAHSLPHSKAGMQSSAWWWWWSSTHKQGNQTKKYPIFPLPSSSGCTKPLTAAAPPPFNARWFIRPLLRTLSYLYTYHFSSFTISSSPNSSRIEELPFGVVSDRKGNFCDFSPRMNSPSLLAWILLNVWDWSAAVWLSMFVNEQCPTKNRVTRDPGACLSDSRASPKYINKYLIYLLNSRSEEPYCSYVHCGFFSPFLTGFPEEDLEKASKSLTKCLLKRKNALGQLQRNYN